MNAVQKLSTVTCGRKDDPLHRKLLLAVKTMNQVKKTGKNDRSTHALYTVDCRPTLHHSGQWVRDRTSPFRAKRLAVAFAKLQSRRRKSAAPSAVQQQS